MERSVWHTALAATRTRASPRPGCGIARSARSKRRGPVSTADRVVFPTAASVHHRDLFHRKVTDDLGPVRVDDQHLLDPYAPLVPLAVLGLQREDHAGPDLQRMVERPDARDHGLVVLGEA